MNTAAHPFRKSYAYVVLATLAVVASADFLLYGHTIGWTAAAIAAVLVAVVAMRSTRFLTTIGGRLIWLATLGLIVALIEQPTWLNVTYVLVCISALSLTNSLGWESDFWPWAKRWGLWATTCWARLFFDNNLAVQWLMRRGLSPRVARAIAAWILPLLLSSVFIALFAWANPIIAGWISHLGTWLSDALANLPELFNFSRMIFWLTFAALAWGLLRSRVGWASPTSDAQAPVEGEVIHRDPTGSGAALVVRCLILFNIVFAVENILDSYYLWAHQGMNATEFKQYVRRGAYPLVAAALLAGTFVLVTFRPGSETEKSNAARKLVYVWIGQTILLTVSAAWRLARYVEMTELTRLRVASTIWFCLVALGLFYVIWRIVRGRSNAWLVNVNAVTALLILYPCCFVNFDGIIADFNARHCEEVGGGGSPLDIEYYRALGPTGLAALDSVRDRIPLQWRRELAQKISDDLYAELKSEVSDWRSWTWRRQRAARDVEAVQLARVRTAEHIAQATPALARPPVQ